MKKLRTTQRGSRKENTFLDTQFKGRVKGTIGTCSRKPHILFWYTTYFNCCLGFFFNKTWNFAIILIHVFNNIKKHKLLKRNSMFILLCEFFIISKYDEMNYNLASRVFYNVFLSVDSSYMK